MSKRRKRKRSKPLKIALPCQTISVDLSRLTAEPPTGPPAEDYETIPLPGGRLEYGDVIDLKGKQVYRKASDLKYHPLGEEGRN
jgi:hypothetical protein